MAVRDPRALRATDHRGRDVTARLAKADRAFVEDLPIERIRGYAREHALTLDFSALPASHTVLLLTGWTDYAFSSDNVAAHQAGQFFKNADCLLAQLRPLDGKPAFESLVAAAKIRKQFAAVKPRCLAQGFDVVGLSAFQERGNINANRCGAQAHRIILDLKDCFIGIIQFLAERRQRLPQAAAGLFVGPVAPEEARQALTGCRHAG